MYNAVIDHQNLFLKGVSIMYNEKRTRKSELLQLVLLDNLYAQSGSERVIFQGGTALRWVYGGVRFSEDLDFVTDLGGEDIEKILAGTFQQTQRACIAQFGPGQPEHKTKTRRKEAISMFYIYRPETQRERIAVKLEFEFLKAGHQPQFRRFVLRDLPRFLPQNILSIYEEKKFSDFIATLKEVTSDLLDQGMNEFFKDHERRKRNP